MKIEICKAKPDDLHDIAKVHAASYITAHKKLVTLNLTELTETRFFERWRKILENTNNYTYVAKDHDQIVGLICFSFLAPHTEVEILYLYIDPDYWRAGIGKMLMEYILRIFQQKQVKKVHIWALKNNPNSRKFYETFGAYTSGEERIITKLNITTQQIKYYIDINNYP